MANLEENTAQDVLPIDPDTLGEVLGDVQEQVTDFAQGFLESAQQFIDASDATTNPAVVVEGDPLGGDGSIQVEGSLAEYDEDSTAEDLDKPDVSSEVTGEGAVNEFEGGGRWRVQIVV